MKLLLVIAIVIMITADVAVGGITIQPDLSVEGSPGPAAGNKDINITVGKRKCCAGKVTKKILSGAEKDTEKILSGAEKETKKILSGAEKVTDKILSALPADTVISKLNGGPRYQYVPSEGGPVLADTWLTSGSMARAARYAPDTDNVYHLFSRQNPTISQPMLLGVPSLIAANFDPSRPTVVLIHGWSSTAGSDFTVRLVPSILAAADVNVIAVDWSAGAFEPNYYAVVAGNVPICGASVASFIFWLNLTTGASIGTYHVIGFETGGHIAGVAGRTLGGLIPYITALELPRPGFILNSNAFSSTDGIFTEVIHTNAGVTGLVQPSGDVDFYPNGGTTMAGCRGWDWECSRDRAYQYLAESILAGGFTAVRCDSLLEATSGSCESEETLSMGGLTAKFGSSGIYYLTTNEQSPFSTG